ncbi:thiosulfate sulfurtransferase 18 isoform X1 [Juglans microcarpa x Juglans regia]|uniref:thiosulfate sulfurtransferase 18 isoform X1 n=1 Tax=Juglans microcarpa x Juglans regia TaxID=2249226 RepID=UPI001B7DD8DD|nr:thiosulfate sulfurtransferase 18 isoform X1 [Juglans microcarpa x Juglans regia]
MGFSSPMLPRVLFLLLVLVFCSSGAEVVTVDVHEAKDLIKSGYTYLDVRTVEEYKKGHVGVDKIFNIPYMFITPEGRVKNPQFLEEVSSACNKEHHLIVGCQSGVRSLYATSDLLTAGFKDVSDMGGGYLAWVESGYPVQKPEAENVSLVPKPEAEL